MISIAVDASSTPVINDLTGQLHGIDATIPPRLYSALNPAYWRLSQTEFPSSLGSNPFLTVFPNAALRPKIIFIFSDWYAQHVTGHYPIGYVSAAAVTAGTNAFVTAYSGILPANSIIDIVNEPDNQTFWSDTKPNFYNFFGVAAPILRGAGWKVCGPSVTKYVASKSWIYNSAMTPGLLDYLLSVSQTIDYVNWHEESGATPTLPTGVAADLDDLSTNVLGSIHYAPLSIQGAMINEYGSQTADQWTNPAMMLGYLVKMEQHGCSIAARTCWPNLAGSDACYNGATISRLLAEDASFAPMSVYEVYRRLGASKGLRKTATYTDTTLDAIAYLAPGRLVVVIGAWGGDGTTVPIPLEGVAVQPIQLSITGLPAGFPSDGPYGAMLLNQYSAVGTSPQLTPLGTAAVAGGAATLTLPPLAYGQAMVVEVGNLDAPSFGRTFRGRGRAVA